MFKPVFIRPGERKYDWGVTLTDYVTLDGGWLYNLSNVIVKTYTPNNENGSEEVIVKVAKGIERDIEDLVR